MRIRLNRSRPSGERRDPRAALVPLGYRSPGRAQIPDWDAGAAYRMAYLANVIVFRCVKVIANSLAGLPFRVGVDPEKPQDYDKNAPLAKLLGPPPGGPAPKISARRLWANAISQYIVTGRFGWEIEQGDRNPVVALWPLVSRFLQAVPRDKGTRGADYFIRYDYGPQDSLVKMKPDEVFYCYQPSLDDWTQAESPLQAARLDISVAVMQDHYDYNFLRNDARPASLIVHEAFAEIDERDTWREQFGRDYGGPTNAGKPMFLEADGDDESGVSGAIDVKQLGLTQRDAEFIKRYERKLQNIAIGLGVPFSILDASGRTFNNSGQEWTNFWQTTMIPYASDFSDAVNMDLAVRFNDGKVGWFDLSKVKALQPAPKFQNLNGVQLVQEEIITPDELREDVFLPPLPDGLGSEVKPKPKPVILPISTIDPAASATAVPEPREKPRVVRLPEVREVDHEQRRTKIWSSFNGQAKTLERAFARTMKSLFKRQLASTIGRLEGKRGRQMLGETRAALDPKVVFDPGFWEDETSEVVAGLYEAVFAAGGARIAGAFGLAFDIDAPFVQKEILKRANKLAGQVTGTTFDSIKKALGDGIEAGEGVPQLAKRIRGVFGDASVNRSKMIARTEVISTYNGSATLVAEELGDDVIGGMEWIASLDSRVRDEHKGANGDVVAVGGTFDVGGESLKYPGDPSGSAENVINCRCTLGMLTPEEMAERGHRRYELRKVEKVLAQVAIGKVKPSEVVRRLELVS